MLSRGKLVFCGLVCCHIVWVYTSRGEPAELAPSFAENAAEPAQPFPFEAEGNWQFAAFPWQIRSEVCDQREAERALHPSPTSWQAAGREVTPGSLPARLIMRARLQSEEGIRRVYAFDAGDTRARLFVKQAVSTPARLLGAKLAYRRNDSTWTVLAVQASDTDDSARTDLSGLLPLPGGAMIVANRMATDGRIEATIFSTTEPRESAFRQWTAAGWQLEGTQNGSNGTRDGVSLFHRHGEMVSVAVIKNPDVDQCWLIATRI